MPRLPKRPQAAAARKRAGGKSDGGLSKEVILAEAIRLIDQEGAQSFSVRSLAKALNVYPTAIYWHIPNRQALVAEVITTVLRDLVPPGELDWRSWLKALFARYRNIIREHPNIAPLIGVQLVSNATVDLQLIESLLEKLYDAGFSGERLVAAYNTVIGGMVGFATQEFAIVPPDVFELQEMMARSVLEAPADRFPHLHENAPRLLNRAFILRWENGATAPMESGFELYADALIAGLDALRVRGSPNV
ncbi:TetR/AcrR family transcriptional regulator [Amorphus sp. 3PC139-8]|uniref:TetR/AcrR family transcriptional regulator n=1 Tax=Amorphus sp. 3PC139-8 TaxID=2735676 RepID=UPI00345D4294